MQKVVIVIIMALLVFSCAGAPVDTEPVNISKGDKSGEMVWTSSYTPVAINVKVLEFVGQKDKSDQKVSRIYNVWKGPHGEIYYVIDLNIRGNWNFPEDYDPTLGRNQNPNNEYLLAHRPMEYAIWEGIHKKSYDLLTSMGFDVPKCKAAVQRGRISPSRKSAVFSVFVQPNQCGQFGNILDVEREYVTFQ